MAENDRPSHNIVDLDSAKLRALAHPLRLRLLGALRTHGPSTATALARLLDTNSGQTSYHLRQLAEVGLIEDDAEHSTDRDRFWKASHDGTSWSSLRFRGDADDRAADLLLVGQVARIHALWVDEWLDARDGMGDDWMEAADMSDLVLHLSPGKLRALGQELHGVLARWRDEEQDPDHPDAERCTVLLNLFPHPDPSL